MSDDYDVHALYNIFLGRPPESPEICEEAKRNKSSENIRGFLDSFEFIENVLARVSTGDILPQNLRSAAPSDGELSWLMSYISFDEATQIKLSNVETWHELFTILVDATAGPDQERTDTDNKYIVSHGPSFERNDILSNAEAKSPEVVFNPGTGESNSRLLQGYTEDISNTELDNANLESQKSNEIRGWVEVVGPIEISGWIEVENPTKSPTLLVRSGTANATLEAKYSHRRDLSYDILGFHALSFSAALPTHLSLDQLEHINLEAGGKSVRNHPGFIFRSPIYFQVLSKSGSKIDFICFDVRAPQEAIQIHFVYNDNLILTVTPSQNYQIETPYGEFEGKMRESIDLASAIQSRRAEITVFTVDKGREVGRFFIINTSIHHSSTSSRTEKSETGGQVDQVGPHFVTGWVPKAENERQFVQLVVNGRLLQSVVAKRLRTDVMDRTGVSAVSFILPLPKKLLGPGENTIDVKYLNENRILETKDSKVYVAEPVGEVSIRGSIVSGHINAAFKSPKSTLEFYISREQFLSIDVDQISTFKDGRWYFSTDIQTAHFGRHVGFVKISPELRLLDWVSNKNSILGTLRSSFDGFTDFCLTGWSFDGGDTSRTLDLIVIVDGRLISEISAHELRRDLSVYNIANLHHGFKHRVDKVLLDGNEHVVDVKEISSGLSLTGSPRVIRFPRSLPDLPIPRTRHLTAFSVPREMRPKAHKKPGGEPVISLIILNRDAGEVLHRVFESIRDHLSLHSIEILVVDHDSRDSSRGVINLWSNVFDMRVFLRSGNNTFSFSNNFAAKIARGRYVAFVNNDLVFTQDVLAECVNYLNSNTDVGLVGIKLLELERRGGSSPVEKYKVHHLGISFVEDSRTGTIRAIEILDDSDNIWRSHIPSDVAAVTGAFCMMETQDFLAIGGFDEEFFFGGEDVALGLKVRSRLGKRVVSLNNVVSFHHRGFMRLSGKMSSGFMARVHNNDKIINEMYGREIREGYRNSLLRGDWVYSQEKLRVAFLVFDAGPSARTGDYFTALELCEVLNESLSCEIYFVTPSDDWTDLANFNIVVNMRNEFNIDDARGLRAHCITVAWLRNNFEDWLESGSLVEYDHILCSSKLFCEVISSSLGILSHHFEIATNPREMSDGISRPEFEADVIFNGSFAGSARTLVQEWSEIEPAFTFRVFGEGWEGTPFERFWGGFVPYDEMCDLYASACIVVDDANISARKWGGTNSRVFDSIIAGRLVITNSQASSDGSFGGILPVWRDGEHLKEIIDHYLSKPRDREELVRKLQAYVMENHTYEVRAPRFINIIRSTGVRHRIAIKIAAPSENTPEVWGDVGFARELAFELRSLGYAVRVETRDVWDQSRERADVNLVLRGLEAFSPTPSAINIIWLISHIESATAEELNRFNVVFVAGSKARDRLELLGVKNTQTLLQCCSPRLLDRADGGAYECSSEVLYVGNTRGVFRMGVKCLVDAGIKFDLAGVGWENYVPIDYIFRERVPFEHLGSLYRGANVVVNDHWDDMKNWGMVSNRIFDCLGAGACVVSDNVAGLRELFGDLVPVYEDEIELKAVIDMLAVDGEKRDRIVREGKELILKEHTFAHRAASIDRAIRMLA